MLVYIEKWNNSIVRTGQNENDQRIKKNTEKIVWPKIIDQKEGRELQYEPNRDRKNKSEI